MQTIKWTVSLDRNISPFKDPGVTVNADSFVAHLTLVGVTSVGGDRTTHYASIGWRNGTILYFLVDADGPRLTLVPRI